VAETEKIITLRAILMFFKLVMRLKENLSTSELVQVGSMIDD